MHVLSKSENEALARSIISGFMLPLDPDVEELADIRCAVSEAVTNCIVHATAAPQGSSTLTAKYYDDRTLKITVSDRGCGIEDVEKARTPLFTTCPDEDRCGMGFSIMESFSDKLSRLLKARRRDKSHAYKKAFLATGGYIKPMGRRGEFLCPNVWKKQRARII